MKTIRKRVSAVIVNDNKILGFHAEDPFNKKRYFFLPGGTPENNETIEQTAIRETLEETGYKITLSKEKVFKKYDFEWNGKTYDCETWFLTGIIESKINDQIKDADYHRGVDWTSLTDIDSVFSYHADILAAVKELAQIKK